MRWNVCYFNYKLLYICGIKSCNIYYYKNITGPMHEGEFIILRSYFALQKYRNSVWISEKHSTRCEPRLYKNSSYIIFIYYNWRLMFEIIWRNNLTKENFIYSKYNLWNNRFYKTDDYKYYNKEFYPI